jgi:hypothetical protein
MQRRLSKGTLLVNPNFAHSMSENGALLLCDSSIKAVLPIVHYFEAEGKPHCSHVSNNQI